MFRPVVHKWCVRRPPRVYVPRSSTTRQTPTISRSTPTPSFPTPSRLCDSRPPFTCLPACLLAYLLVTVCPAHPPVYVHNSHPWTGLRHVRRRSTLLRSTPPDRMEECVDDEKPTYPELHERLPRPQTHREPRRSLDCPHAEDIVPPVPTPLTPGRDALCAEAHWTTPLHWSALRPTSGSHETESVGPGRHPFHGPDPRLVPQTQK